MIREVVVWVAGIGLGVVGAWHVAFSRGWHSGYRQHQDVITSVWDPEGRDYETAIHTREEVFRREHREG